MTDDIVPRLREYWLKHHAHPVADEAADEIERLRAEVAYLKTRLAWHEGTIKG